MRFCTKNARKAREGFRWKQNGEWGDGAVVEREMNILPGERTGKSGARVQELPAETAPFQLMEAVWTPLPVMLTSTMAS